MAAGVRCLGAAQSHTRACESNRARLNFFPLPERRFPGSIQDECTRDAGNRQSRLLIEAMVCRRVLGTLGVESVIGGLVCGIYSVVAASLGFLLYYVPLPPSPPSIGFVCHAPTIAYNRSLLASRGGTACFAWYANEPQQRQ